MDDIAQAAGVTRPVTYKHFGSKERVYLECVRRAREAHAAQIVASWEAVATDDLPSELARGADTFFQILEGNPGRWMLLFGSNAVLPGEFKEELAALRFW